MSKHTPGPWTIKSRNNPHEWDVVKLETPEPDTPWFIAAVFDGAEGRASIDNARLIAAAPDLLAALRKCLNYIENTEGELGVTLDSGDAVRAAIAKATGAA